MLWAYYAGGASQFYMFPCLHGKRSEEIKRELFIQGEVPVLVHSPSEVWEHPRGHHARGCPFLWRMHFYREPPLQHSPLRKAWVCCSSKIGQKEEEENVQQYDNPKLN